MSECAELRFNEDYVRISNFIRYDPSAYYDVEFDLMVCSGRFSGVAPCACRFEDLMMVADDLDELYDFRRSEVYLQDRGYESCVKFELQRTGQLYISGVLYDEHRDQSLEFCFNTDQTVLRSFAAQLRSLLKEE